MLKLLDQRMGVFVDHYIHNMTLLLLWIIEQLNTIKLNRTLKDFTGLYRTLQDFIGLY